MPLTQEARERLRELWKEIGPKSARKLNERARREGIPASFAEVSAFVQDVPDKLLEKLTLSKQTGRSFARHLTSEWKVDLMQFSRPSKEGDIYILIRINSFTRSRCSAAFVQKPKLHRTGHERAPEKIGS